ncbi:MAG TPA: alpha/beta fold hydrolase [Candidatus Saccharimonadales bacterium]|nr:alpha/beta fold hydrolase [Candidatus Saccharimonadales bacterium]
MTGGTPKRWSFDALDSGSGRPILLLHAFPVDRRLYAGLASRLEAGRLIVPDLPGFGATPLGSDAPDVLSVDDLAAALIGWLDRLGLPPVVLGGTAIGGYTALEVAQRRPDLVAGMVLIGCKPAPDAPDKRAEREAVARLALASGSAAVADELAGLPLADAADASTRALVRRMIEEADPRGIAGLVRGIAGRPDPVPALHALRVPVLVVAGTEDRFSRLEDQRALAALVPGARLVEIDGAGHFPSLERPAEVASAIDAFLRGLD